MPGGLGYISMPGGYGPASQETPRAWARGG